VGESRLPEEDLCDVVIIGGGPSGSTIAALMADEGKNVVLLEKDKHPRFHIGESLLPRNLAIFERLGVLGEVAGMGVRKPGAEFVSDETGERVQFTFGKGLDTSFTHSYQVKRADFDQALFANAKRKGARTYELTAVLDVILGGGGVRPTVFAKSADNRGLVFRPRLLIDASGRDAFLGRKFELIEANKRQSTAAVFAHFRNLKNNGATAGYIAVHFATGGWFWMIPLPEGVCSVGFVGDAEVFKTRRGSLYDFLFERIEESPSMREQMKHADPVSEVFGTGNYSYCAKSSCGETYLMIGDAFAFIDPIFSTGVLLAMAGAEIGADIALKWLEDPETGFRLARKAERRARRTMNRIRWFIDRINHPVLRDMFMAPSDRFKMRAGLITLLAGNMRRSWRYTAPLVAFKSMFYVLSVARRFGFRISAIAVPRVALEE
jgi:hypothetical protein